MGRSERAKGVGRVATAAKGKVQASPKKESTIGLFTVRVEVYSPQARARRKTMADVLVDTGSEMTWFPEAELKTLGIRVFRKDVVFRLANGQTVTRDVGIAVLESGEFKTVDEVVFGQPGDLSLLGARTLEGFNATVDTRRKRLVAAGPIVTG